MSPENERRLALLQSAPLNIWVALSEDETEIMPLAKATAKFLKKVTVPGLLIRSS